MSNQINTRKFYSKKNYDKFKSHFEKNRINKEYTYIEEGTNKKVYAIKYYRDTKRMRKKYNFEEQL